MNAKLYPQRLLIFIQPPACAPFKIGFDGFWKLKLPAGRMFVVPVVACKGNSDGIIIVQNSSSAIGIRIEREPFGEGLVGVLKGKGFARFVLPGAVAASALLEQAKALLTVQVCPQCLEKASFTFVPLAGLNNVFKYRQRFCWYAAFFLFHSGQHCLHLRTPSFLVFHDYTTAVKRRGAAMVSSPCCMLLF